MRKEALKRYSTNNLKVILLIILGTLSWSLTMVKSGIVYSYGAGFWGANGHDGIWHVSLINSLARGTFEMPVFAGAQIKNYHLGFDLLVALLHNLTKIPVVNLYFQILPPIFALLIGITCYLFVYALTKSERSGLWATFFVYFGGDLAWIFNKGESTFWAQQSVSTLINPPFALSLILIFLGGYFLVLKKPMLAILFFGILFEVKAYAGVLVLGSLLISSIHRYLFERKADHFKIFLASSVLTFILFILLNRTSENVFIFSPFWFLQSLFNLDRFSISKLASAIANYNLSHNWLKLIPAYILAFVVFWVGNMGTRLLKEFEVIRKLKNFRQISALDIFITSMIITGALIPMLFVQKGTPWNTIQFFYYSLIFSAILAGIALKSLKNKFIAIIIILVTIPTTIITLKDVYIPSRPPAKISNSELEALSFLSKKNDGVVLTFPFDKSKADEAVNNPPRPLYLYDSTAYVSAYGNHPVFLEDEVNLNITDFNWRERRKEVEAFLNTLNQSEAKKFLKNNNINYVYLVKPQRAKLGEAQLGLDKIFENNEVNIYKVH